MKIVNTLRQTTISGVFGLRPSESALTIVHGSLLTCRKPDDMRVFNKLQACDTCLKFRGDLLTRYVEEMAHYDHWVNFPCAKTFMATPWPSSLSLKTHPFAFDSQGEMDKKLCQWLLFLLRSTNDTSGNTEANNTIHGELMFLLHFMLGHGYSVLQATGKDHYPTMKLAFGQMQMILDMMESLARLEDELWQDVNGDMVPCGHCR